MTAPLRTFYHPIMAKLPSSDFPTLGNSPPRNNDSIQWIYVQFVGREYNIISRALELFTMNGLFRIRCEKTTDRQTDTRWSDSWPLWRLERRSNFLTRDLTSNFLLFSRNCKTKTLVISHSRAENLTERYGWTQIRLQKTFAKRKHLFFIYLISKWNSLSLLIV